MACSLRREHGVTEPFSISGDLTIEAGRYQYEEAVVYLSTFRGRRLQLELSGSWGTFFGGKKTTYSTTVLGNFSKHFNVQIDHTWNALDFPTSEERAAIRLETHELALYPTYAFNPNLSVSIFGQWNSLQDFGRVNARLHWIPRIGTDLFLVFDQSHSPTDRIDFAEPTSRSVVGKLVWRVMF